MPRCLVRRAVLSKPLRVTLKRIAVVFSMPPSLHQAISQTSSTMVSLLLLQSHPWAKLLQSHQSQPSLSLHQQPHRSCLPPTTASPACTSCLLSRRHQLHRACHMLPTVAWRRARASRQPLHREFCQDQTHLPTSCSSPGAQLEWMTSLQPPLQQLERATAKVGTQIQPASATRRISQHLQLRPPVHLQQLRLPSSRWSLRCQHIPPPPMGCHRPWHSMDTCTITSTLTCRTCTCTPTLTPTTGAGLPTRHRLEAPTSLRQSAATASLARCHLAPLVL
mmetsp:Transcript_35820/g.101369  ORF Transcript_35820/g.101369 Transcript_35820/m.101369 type:complete len:278 (-) Transcript_35820:682-1515(-)